MSVAFDKASDSNNGDWITADDATKMTPTFPFSVSLWVRFEANVAGTETIWFYGDKDAPDKYLVLEARLVTSVTKLRVRMENASGDGPTSSDTVAVSTGAWHLVTVVATKDGTQVTLTLYLDAEIAKTGNHDVETTNESDYDRFALGRWAGTGAEPLNPGSFLAEQAAIWDSELSSANHGTLFADDLDGEDVRRPPTILTAQPGLGYWILAGHRRHALRLHDSQSAENDGDLDNAASSTQPDFQLGNSAVKPVWSVKTPAVLYNDTATTGIPARKRKVPTARHSPHFYWFAKPELYEPWTTAGKAGLHPVWGDPNMNVMARVPYNPANNDKYEPPQYNANDYHPTSYLTQIAKRVADWFEYQNFTNETGSGGGGQYEGCVYIQALGSQNARIGTLGRDKQDPGVGLGLVGTGAGIPLEQHPKDEVTDNPTPSYPWAVWFRAQGEALVKEYSEEFWPLLKAEFDRRNLAYPKRLHWDYESEPSPGLVLPGAGKTNNFTTQLEDDRGNLSTQEPQGEVLADGKTLGDMWADAPAEVKDDYVPSSKATAPANQPWHRWFDAWKIANRSQALDTAIMAPALAEFSQTLWSNYDDYIADDPDYRYPDTRIFTIYNTHALQPKADFSSPVLYASRFQHTFVPEYGATEHSSYIWMVRARIDACVNASDPLPLAPWFPGVGYETFQNGQTTVLVEVSREDLRHMLLYAWQRGCNEYIMWLSTGPGNVGEGISQQADIDATYDECKFLVNTVKCMMNTNGSRTSRMGRTYRHCR